MGFLSDLVEDVGEGVGDIVGGLTGSTKAAENAAQASTQAAQIQADATVRAQELQNEATDKILGFNQQALDTSRADLQPFRDLGVGSISDVKRDLAGIRDLVTNPESQRSFIQDNPFFKALADDAQSRLFKNSAARGKVGSGGTAKALQNSILLLGTDLVNQNIGQRQGVFNDSLGITQLGANAAAGQAGASQNIAGSNASTVASGAANITDLITGGANAQAAGLVGAANAGTAATQSNIDAATAIGTAIALSDSRFKENVTFIGNVNDVPMYFFKYKGSNRLDLGTMAHHVPHAVIDMGGKKYVDYARV